ncbi:MAG TPA: DUF2157 domain-containing protein [Burkholderiaceae bacterium]|nr:DUF2157 domain-containing protein [Burkholderiaceae bacterium]
MLKLERDYLAEATRAGLITPAQEEPLWKFLHQRAAAAPAARADGPRFTFTNVLYYLGGMLAIGAMSVFMTLGWESFGGWGIFFIALFYIGIVFKLAGRFEKQGLPIPMGIMAALIVVLVPLATWGLQHALGYWADKVHAQNYREFHIFIDWRWTTLEFATLFAGVAMLYRYRAPFLLMPVAVVLWYMSMDLVMLLLPPDVHPWSESEWLFRKWFSLSFGLIMVLVAFWVDLRARFEGDYGFWLYLFGLLASWCALTSLGTGQLAGKLVYLAINLGLILIGAAIVRRTFVVFGAIGVAIVLGDLSWSVFRSSWLFPIALTLIGIGIIYAGIWWSRNEGRLGRRLRASLPADLRALIESRRTLAS